MADYGKILKKNEGNGFTVSLFLFDELGRTSTYSQIMRENYEKGYSQVIINSYLMLKIAEDMIKNDWTLLTVFIDDPSVDEETKKEVGALVESIKRSALNFNKLGEYLKWALDDGSIFIDKMTLAKKVENSFKTCEFYSNGVTFGDNKELIFSNSVKKIVEDYLNEG